MAWASGCSVLYDLETKQCETTADCQALGGVFSELVCTENLCQEPSGCRSNAECMDADTTGNEEVACMDRACVRLVSAECPFLLPKGSDGEQWRENLRSAGLNQQIVLAGMGTINNGTPDERLNNYELALRELDQQVGGMGPGGGRPVVMLACEARISSTDQLDTMMSHLVDTVKVPGIVSALDADDLQRAFNQTQNADVQPFFLSAQESDPALEQGNFNDDGRVWSIGPGADVVARAYAPLLTRTLQHLGLTSDVRVATVLAADTRFLTNTMSTLTAAPESYGLYFNGQSVSANNADDHYLGVQVVLGEANPAAQIQALIAFRPHVIISAAGPEFVQAIIPGVESGWGTGGQAAPFYLLSPYNYNAIGNLITQNASLRTRLLGVNWASAPDPTLYESYLTRLDAAFSDQPEIRGYENFYDAAQYLLYAAAAAGSSVDTGDGIKAGMNRLLSGTNSFNVGENIAVAFGQLAVPNNSIELIGTLGPPDFNPLTGTRTSPGSVFCIDANSTFHSDVLRVVDPTVPNDAKTAALSGTVPDACIPGFPAQ